MLKKVRKILILMLALIFILSPNLSLAAEKDALEGTNLSSLVVEDATNGSKIHSKVKEALDKNKYVEVLVELKEKVDTAKVAKEAKEKSPKNTTAYNKKMIARREVVDTLKSTADRSQKDILDYLAKEKVKGDVKEYSSYYIVNAVSVKANKKVIENLSKRYDVKMIFSNQKITLNLPEVTQNNTTSIDPENIEWGVKRIGASDVWNGLGIDGTGVVVGLIDTGVDYLHPALARKWRGYNPSNPSQPNPTFNWFDPVGNSPLPEELLSVPHGSHCMGTILGGEENGTNAIGVAPGAKFIACKAFSDMGGYNDDLIACAEWMLAPKDANGAGHPEMAPDVINNSWGGAAGVIDEFFRPSVQAWRAAGIVPVFAAGNDGPDEQTVECPGAYPECFTVGAINDKDSIAEFSSRGPGLYDEELQKPNVCAPGVNIRSSVTYGDGHIYEGGWNGTSMATPHVTGVVALMLSADASLTPERIEDILMTTATPLTDIDFPTTPNYAYGYGVVNAFDAVASITKGIGTITGKVVMEGQDSEAPQITHTPNAYTFLNEELPIAAHVSDNIYPSNVELWVTTEGGDVKIDMAKTENFVKEGNYTAVIPGQYITGTSIKYQIKAYDSTGNVIQTPVYNVPTQFGILPGYSTNFSDYPWGWKMSGDWEWGKAEVGVKSPCGESVIATNLDGMYTQTVGNNLVTPPIDLRNVSNATLTIKHWYSFGKDEYGNSDIGIIETSTNGTTWTRYVGVPTTSGEYWKTMDVDLSAYKGSKVYVRFSMIGESGTKSLGWHIGKVDLTGTTIANATNTQINTLTNNTVTTTTSAPLDAVLTVLENGRTVRTNPFTGEYTMKLMPTPEGQTNTLRVEAYGYKTMDKTFSIAGEQQLAIDFALVPKGKGNITGTVVNPVTGAPVAGALVKVIEDTKVPKATTDLNGQFIINNVYEGQYTLNVNFQGYTPLDTQITVTPDQTANCNLKLEPFVTGSSSELAYDGGYADTEHSFTGAGYGWSVRMTPEKYGLVKGIKAYTIDNGYYPGGREFKVAIVDIKPDGRPGETVIMTDPITFTVGQWTYVDLSQYNFCTDRDFYAVIIQNNPYDFACAIGIDTHNISGRSYIRFPDGSFTPYKLLDSADGNLMIRANVDYNGEAPVTITPVINSPANGTTIKDTVSINASVNANVAINKVEFYVDGSLAGTDTSSPYAMDWDTTKVANGNHALQVKAYDAAGNSGASGITTVTVDNTIPDTIAPTCSITSPANGAEVNGTTTIGANASDNVEVTKVEFLVDGNLIGADTSSPYSMDWDTAKVSNGSHTIQVKAYDAAGNVGTSEATTVSVNNIIPDKPAPALISDTTDNNVGKAIDIAFVDDPLWRNSITDVFVNGVSIKGKYTITEGKITIQAKVFPSANNYSIVVKATGYTDAAVTQTINPRK